VAPSERFEFVCSHILVVESCDSDPESSPTLSEPELAFSAPVVDVDG
jgi:hypothetical protein